MNSFRTTRLAAIVALMAITPGAALAANRVWVSAAKGADVADCGPASKPCRSLQQAHNLVADGGEIDILDPGGYGSLAIAKSVAIINDGVGTAGVFTAAGSAIAISAASPVTVLLRGLTIDGGGTATEGVLLSTPGHLSIIGCLIKRFTGPNGMGVAVAPQGSVTTVSLSDAIVADNGQAGISLQPGGSGAVQAVLRNVTVKNAAVGVLLSASSGTVVSAVVERSLVTGAADSGLYVFSGGSQRARLVMRGVVSKSNARGLYAARHCDVDLSDSTLKANTTADIEVVGTCAIKSYKNNSYDTVTGAITPADLR